MEHIGKLLIPILLLPSILAAEISGPEQSPDGSFTLTWDGTGTILRELDSGTGALLNTWTDGGVTLVRVSGTHSFTEFNCSTVPFAGYICFPRGLAPGGGWRRLRHISSGVR